MEWCEDYEIPVNRQYKKFEAPSLYIGVDALTEEELRSIASLDFAGQALQRHLYYGYSAKHGLTIDSPMFRAYLAEIELARDKFLECAYSAMHIADADAARRSHIKHIPGIKDRVLEVSRAKTSTPATFPSSTMTCSAW